MIIKNVELMIALRYLTSKSKDKFISISTIFSLIGIMLGVATLIIVMSVMKGYETELIKRILGINGHINITAVAGHQIDDYRKKTAEIIALKEVSYAAPIFTKQAMILSINTNIAEGVVIRAIDGEDFVKKPMARSSLIHGSIENYTAKKGVLLGNILASRIGVFVGDKIKIITPNTDTTIIGSIPRAKLYKVVGIFDTGMYEYNSGIVFMPLSSAQQLFKINDSVNHIEILLNDIKKIPDIKSILQNKLTNDQYITDWTQMNKSLIDALTVERNVMFLILTLIIIVAVFNIISSLIMLVKDKLKDIGILKTIGMTRNSVIHIFIICGAIIGMIGTISGVIMGVIFCYNINSIKHLLEHLLGTQLFDPVIYFLTSLPIELDPFNVFMISIMTLILSLITTIYPAYKAGNMMPTEVLRYE